MTSKRMRGLAVVALCIGSLAVTSCGKEREYAVPRDLCGVKVSPELVEPFLPAGDSVSQNDGLDPPEVAGIWCAVSVDGREELKVTGDWVLKSNLDTRISGISHPSRIRGGKYVVGKRGATTALPCRNPKARIDVPAREGEKQHTVPADTYVIEVRSYHEPEGVEESKKAMARFIVAFTESLKKSQPCS